MNFNSKGDRSNDHSLVPASPKAVDAPHDPAAIARALNEMPENLQAHELLHLHSQDPALLEEVIRQLKALPAPAIKTVPTGAYYDPQKQVMVFEAVTIIEGEAIEILS